MKEQLALLPNYLTAHLQLTLFALLVGVVVSIPLGVLAARIRWLEQPVLGTASVIQTIPALALLAVMVPLLSAAHLPSIGFLPAFIGLVLYSVLPIVRNTVTGLTAIDTALIEAARGVGMTQQQRLIRVELPLAMPVIIAGIRTATIWTVGTATLSTPVGATSLGNYIFTGLQTRNQNAIIVGCVAAALLALTLDGLVRLIAIGWERRHAGTLWVSFGALIFLYVYAGHTWLYERVQTKHERILVGAKTFTEQYILSEILAGHIRHETGIHTEIVPSLGSTVVFDALRSGEIDVYVGYSGTIWATLMHRETDPAGRTEILAEVEQFLRDQYGIATVGALGFENTYALAMRNEMAEQLQIRSISDLVAHAPTFSIGSDYEFLGRPEWRSVRATYGLQFATERSMDASLMYQAVARENVDVISAFSTDGRVAALNLRLLEDDRGAIPPYDAVILASANLQRRHPKAIAALRGLVGKIDNGMMRQMNRAADLEGQSTQSIATAFLKSLRHGT